MTLASERVVPEAPMSFTGSGKRIWKLVHNHSKVWTITLGIVAILLIVLAWTVVLAWYFTFGLLLVPYRLVRRNARKQKQAELRHRELLNRN